MMISQTKIQLATIFFAGLTLFTKAFASGGENQSFKFPAESRGTLSFFSDICQFEGRDNQTAVEVYYSLDLAQLSNSAIVDSTRLLVNVTFLNARHDTVSSTSDRRAFAVESSHDGSYSFTDMKRFELPDEVRYLNVTIEDPVSKKRGFINRFFQIRTFDSALSVSDLMLSSRVQKAQGEHSFDKGGLLIVPNANRSFLAENNDTRLFIYFEINNLEYQAGNSSYKLEIDLKDLQNEDVFSVTKPEIRKSGVNLSRVEVVPLSDLATGHYTITVWVTDLTTGEKEHSMSAFRYSSGKEEDALFLPMTEGDVKKYYDQIKYLASAEEKRLFRQLPSRGKQEFLLRFWQVRDPSAGTSDNEFMMEHFRRIAYCDAKIGGGLDSDMGRIYILYGEPINRIHDFSRLGNSKPVEVWEYAVEGVIQFVFVDRAGDGEYTLVHSTQRDEIYNPNWQDNIRQ